MKRVDNDARSGVQSALENARDNYMREEKEMIVGKYTLPKKPGKDGYYRVYVNDNHSTNGRRQLSARSIECLADKIYLYEKGIGSTRKTFSEVFELVEEKKLRRITNPEKLCSAQNTVNKHKGDYKRYFKGTDFENKYIDEITKKDIEDIIESILTKYHLTKKAYSNMVTILRSSFKMAYSEYWIDENVFLRVDLSDFWGMLYEPIPSSERAYSTEEVIRILKSIRDHQKKYPTYMPAYALELQILIGSRRSEAGPLEWADIDSKYIELSKSQLTIKKTEDCKQHLVVVNHTKNHKDRTFPRTNDVNVFLEKLKEVHIENNLNSKYLFPADTPTGVVSHDAVYGFYRRTINKLGLKKDDRIMGPHSFRRNVITDIVNATNGDLALASQLCGNSTQVAMNNYYIGYDLETAINALNKRRLTN